MPKLGVNIDHVATLRQARREFDPDPIHAAKACEKAGAHSIVAHLREDRRHIQDKDLLRLKEVVTTRFNLELSLNPKILRFAARLKPHQATLVPERRQEITTEGGLDVIRHSARIKKAVALLQDKGIEVSLFIDPSKKQIDETKKVGAAMIELHTGSYALHKGHIKQQKLQKVKHMTTYAQSLGLIVNAGHGLNYENTKAIASLKGIEELNIGHAIISRAVFVGLHQAVREMLKLVKG